MILPGSSPDNEVELVNVGEVRDFKIKATAKSFRILSSGLYANKIKAIVREISCNAYDGHAKAGKADVPFEVHLPTFLEPWFSVKDFGVGLSDDQMEIFTTFFDSTKNDSNIEIGGLGLGAKSPFGYTDNFTIDTIKDGERRIYSAFLNSNGFPSTVLLSSTKTNDENGVEVKIPIANVSDFSKFSQEAMNVFPYFKVRPVITGDTITIPHKEYEDKDIIPGVHLYHGGRHYSHQSIAVMGSVAYPIDTAPTNNFYGPNTSLLTHGLEIHFDIGDLDIQPSREGLSYIKLTINNIAKKLNEVKSAIDSKFLKKMAEFPNDWEAAGYIISVSRRDNFWYSSALNYVKDGKNKLLEIGIHSSPAPIEFFTDKSLKALGIKPPTCVQVSESCNRRFNSGIESPEALMRHMTFGAYGSPDWFVINDLSVSVTDRVNYHFGKMVKGMRNGINVFVISRIDKNQDFKYEEFLKTIHNPPNVMFASQLERDPNSFKQKRPGDRVNIRKLVARINNGRPDGFAFEELTTVESQKLIADTSKTYYYFPLKGMQVESNIIQDKDDRDSFVRMLRNCGLIEYQNIDVYGVMKQDIEHIVGITNWVNLEKHVMSTFVSLTENDIRRHLQRCGVQQYVPDILKYYLQSFIRDVNQNSYLYKHLTKFVDSSKVVTDKTDPAFDCKKLAREVGLEYAKLVYGTESSFMTLAIRFGLDAKLISDIRYLIVNEGLDLVNYYPLLRYIEHVDERAVAHTLDYIKMIDDEKAAEV